MSLLTPELAARAGESVSYTAPEPLGRAAIRYYRRAVGAVGDDLIAPPTMIFETNQYLDREPDAHGFAGHGWGIEVPGTRLIRGGSSFVFHSPVLATTIPTLTWTIGGITERTGRSGAAMLVVESTGACTDQDGTLLAETTETLIYQALAPSDGSAVPPSSAGRDPSTREQGGLSGGRTITLTDMVRYAGATWDWHQLHYDPAYLASVGLDRPVVDGQMLGAFMADDLGRHGTVRTLGYRFRSMVFAGESVEVETSPAGQGRFDQVVRVGDRVCVTGGGTVDA